MKQNETDVEANNAHKCAAMAGRESGTSCPADGRMRLYCADSVVQVG